MAKERGHNVRENLMLALDTLRTHKFRSLLTILGVLIGTLVVIMVASIFKGLDQQMVDAMQGFGTRSLFIFKFEPGISFHLSREERLRKPLTYEEAMAIKEECPAVEAVGVEVIVQGPPAVAKYQGLEMVDTIFRGATPEHIRNINVELHDGRLYTDFDDLHRRDVAVIGDDVVTRFFEGQDPIGKVIQVDGHSYEVIGALNKRKAFPGNNSNDAVIYVPYFTYRKIYPKAKENLITAVAFQGKVDQAKDEVTALLRRLRGDKPSAPDSFGIATADSIINQFRDMMSMVVLVTVVVSSIGLLVGGIGVMNIMLVSVTERTREIGVRKAIGARRSDITWQFLLEAMTLTATGGLLGILLAVVFVYLIRTLMPVLPATVPLWAVAAGFVASVSIGLFFGMWPAMKAARLDPIVALRHE
jgi:ABC-type antimicrobial peptide transport system permease subunit